MENSSFRALAPATRPRSPPPPQPEPPAKRKRTSVACDLCRERRTGCDGVRPICAACRKRNTPCTYINDESLEMRPTVLKRENTMLREKLAAFQEIISHLSDLPQHTARDVLQRLRNGADPVVLLKAIQYRQLEVNPSAQDAARALLPSVQSSTEFELLVRHPNAFPALDLPTALELSKQAQSLGNILAVPSTPSQMLGSSSSSSSRAVSTDPGSAKTLDSVTASSLSRTGDLKGSKNDTGHAHSEYFDPRLALLEISFWTTVPITNAQASKAISCYLEVQHYIWGVFDAGLFVEDLIGFGFQFCSPFMVSALLAVACSVYRPLDIEASNQSYAFEKEAEKLLQSETELDSLPTISGLALLYMSISTHGEGMRGLKYLTMASDTAERMKLYGVSEESKRDESLSHEQVIARSATAWGMFNMTVFLARLYLIPPVEFPPKVPLPGKLGPAGVMVELTGPKLNAPVERLAELDEVLACVTKFWIIMNEVFLVYRDQEINVASLAFALSKYSKLLRLVDHMPQSLKRETRSTNHALMYHMHLHLGIMDIFRPFLGPEDEHRGRSFLPSGASPKTIYAASVRQIKGLIFEYTSQYEPASYNLIYPGAIIYAVNAVLNDKNDPDRRAYFFFYIEAGRNLRSIGSAPTVTGTFMAMLALAYDKGVISNAEAVWWKERFHQDGLLKMNKHAPSVRSGWAVDMDVAAVDIAASNADVLADRFAEIALFDELTQGVV